MSMRVKYTENNEEDKIDNSIESIDIQTNL